MQIWICFLFRLKAITQRTRFWPTKPDCGPPLPQGVLPPRGVRKWKGGGRRAAPRPALSAGEESSFFSKSTV